MPKRILPRIVEVAPGDQPMTLRVRWDKGEESFIDVSGMIQSFRVYAPLRQSPELFRQVKVGEYGTDVVWTDEIDMAVDTLWRLAQEQAGETMTPDAFRHWRERKAYTLNQAARALGLSRRTVAYYEKGDRAIPRVVALATTVASMPGGGYSQMTEYEEIEDIDEIDRLLRVLARNLISLSDRHEQRRINTQAGQATSAPIIVYYFKQAQGLWFAHRVVQRSPKSAPQYNNLFGYNQPGTLGSKIEVNFPVREFRLGKLQGALVRNRETDEVLLAHRGKVTIRRQPFVSILNDMKTLGASLIHVSGNHGPVIRVSSVNSPQLQEIGEFVKNVIQAKS